MNLLKRDYWWMWLLFFLFGSPISNFILGALLNVYDSDAWYTNYRYWVIALICFIFPFFILLYIFMIQVTVMNAKKLNVPGSDLYGTPYVWILCLIVPVIGWIAMPFIYLYLNISILIALSKGEGEQYI